MVQMERMMITTSLTCLVWFLVSLAVSCALGPILKAKGKE